MPFDLSRVSRSYRPAQGGPAPDALQKRSARRSRRSRRHGCPAGLSQPASWTGSMLDCLSSAACCGTAATFSANTCRTGCRTSTNGSRIAAGARSGRRRAGSKVGISKAWRRSKGPQYSRRLAPRLRSLSAPEFRRRNPVPFAHRKPGARRPFWRCTKGGVGPWFRLRTIRDKYLRGLRALAGGFLGQLKQYAARVWALHQDRGKQRALWRGLSFQAAAVCAASISLLSDAVSHMHQMRITGNFAPGKAGVPFYTNVIVRVLCVVLLALA